MHTSLVLGVRARHTCAIVAPQRLVAERLDSVQSEPVLTMADFTDDWAEESSYAGPAEGLDYTYVQGHQSQNVHWNMQQTATTKIPPAFDGTTSWFAYEKAIGEWCDVTELSDEKRGPALRNILIGEADIYKDYLDPEQLREAGEGVDYLKRTLRPFFVKGTSHISVAIHADL